MAEIRQLRIIRFKGEFVAVEPNEFEIIAKVHPNTLSGLIYDYYTDKDGITLPLYSDGKIHLCKVIDEYKDITILAKHTSHANEWGHIARLPKREYTGNKIVLVFNKRYNTFME